jgi:hypothetical protein
MSASSDAAGQSGGPIGLGIGGIVGISIGVLALLAGGILLLMIRKKPVDADASETDEGNIGIETIEAGSFETLLTACVFDYADALVDIGFNPRPTPNVFNAMDESDFPCYFS